VDNTFRQRILIYPCVTCAQGCLIGCVREQRCRWRTWRTDGRTRRIVIGHIRVKTKLHAQIRFYVLPLVNTVGWHGTFKGEVDFYANISSMCRGHVRQRGGRERSRGARTAEGGGGRARLGREYAPLSQPYAPHSLPYAPLTQAYAPLWQAYAPLHQVYAPLRQAYAPHNLPYAPLTQAYAPLYQCMRPSDRRMRPTICRMRPLRKRMRPSNIRMRPSDMRMRPSASVCAPQPAVYAWSNPNHPTWQRCGSHRGQGKSRFTLSKVNKTLTLIGGHEPYRTWRTDGRDGRMDAQTTLHAPCLLMGLNFGLHSS
jgi:hypothetical protein